MYPLLKHSMTLSISVFLFVTLLLRVTAYGQGTVNTFGIFPPATDVLAVNGTDNAVIEQTTNENIGEGIANTFGIFPPPTNVTIVKGTDNPVIEQTTNENIGEGIANTFDSVPPSTGGVPADKEPNKPVVERIPNENIDKGGMELVQPATGDCLCVPYYLCNDDNTLNTDGTGIIDIRFSGLCEKMYYKCCNFVKNEDDNNRLNDKDNRVNCGHWNYKGVGVRIIGDVNNEAQFGEFPWMVAILKMDSVQNHTLCGASLIHPQVVLTAFHCVSSKDTSNLVIRAGEWDLKSEDEHILHQDRHVLKIIKHENYYSGASYNDIALIILTKKFILDDNVGTICLPPQGYQFHTERCHVSGWGKNAVTTDYSAYQNILKKIDVPVVPQSTCLELLRLTRLGQRFKLHDSFMCAGGEIGKDACKGDGGSPLVCPLSKNPLQFQQAGIVAWGIGCGDKTPGVYVNVAQFRDWIDQNMDKNEMDKSYYDPDFNVSDTPHR